MFSVVEQMLQKRIGAVTLLLGLKGAVSGHVNEQLLIVAQNLQNMYSRPYFPHNSAAKTLILLRALLKVFGAVLLICFENNGA